MFQHSFCSKVELDYYHQEANTRVASEAAE